MKRVLGSVKNLLGRGLLTIIVMPVRSVLVRTVLLCSMAAYAAFGITLKAYDPVQEKNLKLYLAVNAYYLGCLQAMHYNGISRSAMNSRCQKLTDYYYSEINLLMENNYE